MKVNQELTFVTFLCKGVLADSECPKGKERDSICPRGRCLTYSGGSHTLGPSGRTWGSVTCTCQIPESHVSATWTSGVTLRVTIMCSPSLGSPGLVGEWSPQTLAVTLLWTVAQDVAWLSGGIRRNVCHSLTLEIRSAHFCVPHLGLDLTDTLIPRASGTIGAWVCFLLVQG